MLKLVLAILVIVPLAACQTPKSNLTTFAGKPYDRGQEKTEGFGFVNFDLDHSKNPWNYAVVKDPTGSAPTEFVERFEIRYGDCGRNEKGSWDGCAKDRHRIERVEEQFYNGGYVPKGEHYGENWYSWFIYFPKDWKSIYPASQQYGQFYDRWDNGVNWQFRMRKGFFTIERQLATGNILSKHRLVPGYEMLGRWTHIKVHANWDTSDDGDGFLKVYINDKLEYDYKGRTTATNSGGAFKYGIYQSWLSKVTNDKYPNGEGFPTQVLYYTQLRKAETEAGLLYTPATQ